MYICMYISSSSYRAGSMDIPDPSLATPPYRFIALGRSSGQTSRKPHIAC